MFKVKITIKHDEIIKWVIKHHGRPVILDDSEARGDKIGIRIDFPGKKDEKYLAQGKTGKPVSWDKFFEVFERQRLAFTYQEKGYEKDPALMYEFIKRKSIIK